MKGKLLLALVLLTLVWVSVTGAEYELAMCFGTPFDVFVSIFTLLVLLVALIRAPEGYEDERGFHIGALASVAAR